MPGVEGIAQGQQASARTWHKLCASARQPAPRVFAPPEVVRVARGGVSGGGGGGCLNTHPSQRGQQRLRHALELLVRLARELAQHPPPTPLHPRACIGAVRDSALPLCLGVGADASAPSEVPGEIRVRGVAREDRARLPEDHRPLVCGRVVWVFSSPQRFCVAPAPGSHGRRGFCWRGPWRFAVGGCITRRQLEVHGRVVVQVLGEAVLDVGVKRWLVGGA